MELKRAALCYKTCRAPSFTLFLIALQLWGLAGLPVVQADYWEKLFFVLGQVTHSSAALFLENCPNLSPAFCPAHCTVEGWAKPFWLPLGAAGQTAAPRLSSAHLQLSSSMGEEINLRE